MRESLQVVVASAVVLGLWLAAGAVLRAAEHELANGENVEGPPQSMHEMTKDLRGSLADPDGPTDPFILMPGQAVDCPQAEPLLAFSGEEQRALVKAVREGRT